MNQDQEMANLFISPNKIILKVKNRKVAIDRLTLKSVAVADTSNCEKIDFFSVLGLYCFYDYKFMVFVTKVDKISDFMDIYQIKDYKIIPIKVPSDKDDENETNYFVRLLKKGFNQCRMYFSMNHKIDLTLTYQQQMEKSDYNKTRTEFIWNDQSLKTLRDFWPGAITCLTDRCPNVIGGFVKQYRNFLLISRKGNKNGGCHTWNRGSDENGNVANFMETEEIFFREDGHTFSHVEIRGSCPLFWSQYPTMQITRPFRFGPESESFRRFELHFDKLEKLYGKNNIVIASLTEYSGKERTLSETYKKFAQKRKLAFEEIEFNSLIKKPGVIFDWIKSKFLEKYVELCEVEDHKIIQRQTKFIRVNCASCLDRTNVFMSLIFLNIMKKYGPSCSPITSIHKELWIEQAHVIAMEYACTRGMKVYMTTTGYQPLIGSLHDYPIMIMRYTNSLFIEGTVTDAYTAVLQERPIYKYPTQSFLHKVLAFLSIVLAYIYLYLFVGKDVAYQDWRTKIKYLLNHPSIEDLRDADEFDENDFFKYQQK